MNFLLLSAFSFVQIGIVYAATAQEISGCWVGDFPGASTGELGIIVSGDQVVGAELWYTMSFAVGGLPVNLNGNGDSTSMQFDGDTMRTQFEFDNVPFIDTVTATYTMQTTSSQQMAGQFNVGGFLNGDVAWTRGNTQSCQVANLMPPTPPPTTLPPTLAPTVAPPTFAPTFQVVAPTPAPTFVPNDPNGQFGPITQPSNVPDGGGVDSTLLILLIVGGTVLCIICLLCIVVFLVTGDNKRNETIYVNDAVYKPHSTMLVPPGAVMAGTVGPGQSFGAAPMDDFSTVYPSGRPSGVDTMDIPAQPVGLGYGAQPAGYSDSMRSGNFEPGYGGGTYQMSNSTKNW